MKVEVFLVLACSIIASGIVIENNRARIFKEAVTRERRSMKDNSGNRALKPRLNFQKVVPPHEIRAHIHESVMLECHAAGNPPPTVHWLKNGEKVSQSANEYEDNTAEKEGNNGVPTLGISSTRSKLFIDCVLPQDAGDYTCIAETQFNRISHTTKVIVTGGTDGFSPECISDKRDYGKPGRIIMWTGNRLENQGNDVQLFCRATGFPKPHITWTDRDGEILKEDEKYQPLPNGDLLIRKVDWEQDMGTFTCEAANEFGRDRATTFLYPTAVENK